MAAAAVLEVDHLTKRFGNHAALNAVSFSVCEREVVALLGDNGAGKSTLVKRIAGIYRPDDGDIRLAGERFHAESPSGARARGVGIVYRVILDEPTAALGLRERGNVLRLVRQLPEMGVAVVLISHNLEDVIAVADRAVVLRQGRKVGEVQATEANHETMVSLIVGGQSASPDGRAVQ